MRKRMSTINDLLGKIFYGSDEENDDKDAKVVVHREQTNARLRVALVCGDKKAVESLLRQGADPNLANEEGRTPLHVICHRGRNDGLIDLFFKVNDGRQQRVQIDAQDKLGNTPLHLALEGRHRELAEFLVKRGASMNLANVKGLTPLHLFCQMYCHDDMLKLFAVKVHDQSKPAPLDSILLYIYNNFHKYKPYLIEIIGALLFVWFIEMCLRLVSKD